MCILSGDFTPSRESKSAHARLQGTNLFNDAAGRFTQFGAGAPYLGVGGISLPTDRLFVEPIGFRFIFTAHM